MLHIHLFHSLTLYKDGEQIQFSGLPKTTSLFAYLLLYRNQPIFREKLAAVLWGDVADTDARANLRRHLYNLAKVLPAAREPWLITTRKQIQWNPAAKIWLDVAEFEGAALSTTRLSEAASLYSGDLLPNLYEDWVRPERKRLKDVYLQVLSRLAREHQERGDDGEALRILRRLLLEDPFRETAVRTTMDHLFYNMRDRTGALDLYQQFKSQLAEELNVLPMSETISLYARIAKAQSPPPSDQTARPPNNLPAPINRFIGREGELAALCDQIGNKKSASRLVTITGAAGSGKTRLGLATGRKLLLLQNKQFKDGIYFVELAPLTKPDQVAEEIDKVLEIDQSDGVAPLKKLLAVLPKRRLLLILDNFEHLLEAADVLARLLREAPELHILVTSQAPLHLYGEFEFPLAPLPLPETSSTSFNALSENASVELFVDRVRAVQPSFSLNEENIAAVIEICTQLDGIPLAIELAAARSKFFSLSSMISQLNNRLQFLTGNRRNVPARQKTLRAAIDWSYHLLSAEEKQIFHQLAVFAGSITLEAAAQTAAQLEESSVEAYLFTLVERNMVQMISTTPDEPRRFSFLSVLREYGLEKLQDNQAEEKIVKDRFARYYIRKVEMAETQMYGSEQAEWLRWLHWEAPNLSSVHEYLLKEINRESAPFLLRFTMAMERVWELEGRFSIARQWLEQVLPYRQLLPVSEQIRLLNKVGGMAQWTAEYEIAEGHHQDALKLAQINEDEWAIANTLHHLGTLIGRQGNYEEAQNILEESLMYSQNLPELTPNKLSVLLNNLAIVYKRQKKYSEAETLLLDALSIRQEAGDQIGVANIYSTLSGLILEQNRIDQAKDYLQQSLQIRYALGDRSGLINTLHHLAVVGIQEERWDYGIKLLAYCAASREQMGSTMAADFKADFDRAMILIQIKLNEDEIAAQWEVGKNLSLDTIIDFAQSDSA